MPLPLHPHPDLPPESFEGIIILRPIDFQKKFFGTAAGGWANWKMKVILRYLLAPENLWATIFATELNITPGRPILMTELCSEPS
jgi:hypothetical protein